jgi:hypothetical protein
LLCVPAACAAEPLLQEAARFRSQGRIPTLSWRCPWTGATISRCAQPLSGLRVTRAGRSRGDEALVRGLWRASALPLGRGDAPHLILDCRPRRNAQANAVAGKGFEDMALYGRRRRASYDHALRRHAEGLGSSSGGGGNSSGGGSGGGNDSYFDDLDGSSHPATLAAAAEAAARAKLDSGVISPAEFAAIVQRATDLSLASGLLVAEHSAAQQGGAASDDDSAAVARVADSPLPTCELVFADIENIHVQRRAFRDVLAASNEGGGGGAQGEAWEQGEGEGGGGGSSSSAADLPAAAAVWLKHVGSVLAAARAVAEAVRRRRRSVLVRGATPIGT